MNNENLPRIEFKWETKKFMTSLFNIRSLSIVHAPENVMVLIYKQKVREISEQING